MGKKIITIIGVVAAIITIATTLIAIANKITNLITVNLQENYYQVVFVLLALIILFIAIDILIRTYLLMKYKALSWGRLQSYLIFYQFVNKVKNSSYKISTLYKKSELTIEFIEEERNRIIKVALEGLCDFFYKTIGYEVRSCMKILGFQNDNNKIQIIVTLQN